MIKIYVVGKRHESWVGEGITMFNQRTLAPFNIEWALLPHSSLTGDAARAEESRRLMERLKPDDHVILLDEAGIEHTSPALSAQLEDLFVQSKRVVMIIGGAYGVDDSLHQRANHIWSLSKLVFPHQLVRLLVSEQLYRAQEIARGGRYHHE